MKVCYVDESGTGNEPIATMVGIIVDSQRMHVTKEHWGGLLKTLSKIVNRPLQEIHTRDFYSGNDVWHKIVDGPDRARVISSVFEWLDQRKHQVVFTSIDKRRYFNKQKEGIIFRDLNTPWRCMGFHLTLAIQKRFQREAKTKGNTIMIFDNEEQERMRFTDLIKNPPDYSDNYYARGKKQEKLDQIIDVPFFGDSREIPLIQVADFVAFFLRRYAEVKEGAVPQRYEDETSRLDGWARMISSLSIGRAMTYPAKGRDDLSEMFYSLAPSAIRNL